MYYLIWLFSLLHLSGGLFHGGVSFPSTGRAEREIHLQHHSVPYLSQIQRKVCCRLRKCFIGFVFRPPHCMFNPSCHECLLWTGLYSASFSGDDNNAALLFQWWSGQLGERRWCGNGRWGLCGDGARLPGTPRRPPGPRAAEIPKTSQRSVQPHELRHRIFTGSQWGVYRGSSQN